MMLSITKLQDLKAIHNATVRMKRGISVVINRKTIKFESNSQPSSKRLIWAIRMLSITKLQNLKAIHNALKSMRATFLVVINHKTTKFENNSQRATHTPARRPRCYQSQNCKI